jgi:SPP1 gp7 family putative phage head morphogenesis protein
VAQRHQGPQGRLIVLGKEDIRRLKNSAKVAQRVENKWSRRLEDEILTASRQAADAVSAGADPVVPDFERLLIEHWFESHMAGFKEAEGNVEEPKDSKLMADLWIRMGRRPRTLKDIMRAYDLWRRGLFKPRKAVREAKDLKRRYLDAVKRAWKRYSGEFREGDVATQDEVREKVRDAAKTTTSRAQTIVRTETTRYYNQARIDVYDKAPDITHYLFLAVRDKATTPWCCRGAWHGDPSRRKSMEKAYGSLAGYVGRSGLVYTKGAAITIRERPPCHWNCRSEFLPLNRFNPAHRRLIADESIRRENVKCYPLPRGWNKAA